MRGNISVLLPPPTPFPGRIRTCELTVTTNTTRLWKTVVGEAIDRDGDLYLVGGQYPPGKIITTDRRIVLFNNTEGVGGDAWQSALAWARARSLRVTDPRTVVSLFEQHPDLHQHHPEVAWGYLVATKPCVLHDAFHGLYFRRCRKNIEPGIHFAEELGMHLDWFVFSE